MKHLSAVFEGMIFSSILFGIWCINKAYEYQSKCIEMLHKRIVLIESELAIKNSS